MSDTTCSRHPGAYRIGGVCGLCPVTPAAEFTAAERTAWQQGYEFALVNLADEPVRADRARYLAGGADTAATIPTEHPGPTYMSLDHGPWVPSGLECGDIHPIHDDCEQPIMQRTVVAVYLSRRVDLGVELEDHARHAKGGEGELAERLEDVIDAHLEEDAHTTASTKAADAVMAQIRPLLDARDRIAELEEENQKLRVDLAAGHRFHVGPIELYQAHSEEHTDAWTLVSKNVAERVEGGIQAALSRAREITT